MIPANIRRLIYINKVLSKNGLDEIIFAVHLFRPLRYFYYMLPWNWFPRKRSLSKGARIRKSLEDLGPVFVKFGQVLSTRRDLLPTEIADELAKLQDQVPEFATDTAIKIIEESYGQSLHKVFSSFEMKPIAAASVAQVYAAKLHNGKDVIVKVIRPGIEKTIHQDLKLLNLIAVMAERYSSEARRLRPVEVVADYKKTILDELDLKREAANASLIKRQFEGSTIFYVPEVHWPYTKTNVLVMERISGVMVSDVETLHARNVNMKVLAERGVEIFFTQVFKNNFFHADMHPGNIFVNADDPEDPKYIGVDFGIVGALSQNDRRYLAENFLAFFERDYRRVADLHIHSGWAADDVSPVEFEAAIRTVCEPIFERPLKEISFGYFLLNLFQTARRFNLHIQPQLVLLQKTLLNVEGLGRQLYPDLDLWQTAKPFLQKAMKKDAAYHAVLNKLPFEFPQWLRELPEAPRYLLDVLQKLSDGTLNVKLSSEELKTIQLQIKKNGRQQFYAGAGGALVLSAMIVFGLDSYHYSPLLAGMPLLSVLLLVPGLWMLLSVWTNKD